jgi:hypothetical protein
MIEKSADISEIAKALLAFQAEATGVVKDSKNPHFKNRYASLEAVVDEARPVLQRVGISWMQAPGKINAGNIGMTTLLMHAASGQWISSDMEIPLGKQDPQGAGSALTYAQRYALMASLGLPPVDDDAESAFDRNSSSAPSPGRNAAGALARPPATGAPAASLSDVSAFIGEMRDNTTSRDLVSWSTSREIMTRYNKLDRKDRDTVDAAYNTFLAELDRKEAA